MTPFFMALSWHYLPYLDWLNLSICWLGIINNLYPLSKKRDLINKLLLGWLVSSFLREFPLVANHHILAMFLIPCLIQTHIEKEGSKNYLLWILRILYFFVVFHKLNSGYFNPELSCAKSLPLTFLQLFNLKPESVALTHLSIYISLIMEFFIFLGLIFPRGIKFSFLLAIILHAILSLNNFFDFSGIAFLCFYFLTDEKTKQDLAINLSLKKSRHLILFFSGQALAILIFYFHFKSNLNALWEWKVIVSLTWFLLFIYFIFQLYHVRLHFVSSELRFPSSLFLKFLLFIFTFNALCPYLGLKTISSLSMFSNLKTENGSSNHFLLKNNPLEIFSYQKDLVYILDAYGPPVDWIKNPGAVLPLFMFYQQHLYFKDKKVHGITLTYKYRGQIFKTNDFIRDHFFKNVNFNFIERFALGFRELHPDEQMYCRW